MTGTVTKRKTSSGKVYLYIRLSYKDPDSHLWRDKIISTGVSSQDDIERIRQTIPTYLEKYFYLEQKYGENGQLIINDETPFFRYMFYWLEKRRIDVKLGNLRKSTFEKYDYEVHRMAPYFEKQGFKIKDISKKEIFDYLDYAREYGKTDQKTHENGPLSNRTIGEYKGILKQIFDYAIKHDEIIRMNPCDGIRNNKKTKHKKDKYLFLREDEAVDLMQFVKLNDKDFYGIVFFGMYYGLRREEILGLRWNAVDLNKKSMEICYTVTYIKGIHAEADVKTENSFRTLPLNSKAIEILENINKKQAEAKRIYGRHYQNKDNYVFTWPDGRPFRPDYLSRHFKRIITKFGRPELTFHKLRHTCASMLISQNWNPKQVQYWMGHSDIQTTLNIYTHIDKLKLFEKMDDLEAITASIDSQIEKSESNNSKNIVTL